MIDDDFIISGFGSNNDNLPLFTVDFANAKRLERSGSTCDAFECTIQRRRVFVKRLKSEYFNNPLYRAAFDKEYDVGVSLRHPSLPRYVGCGDGYIVMDFVEGDTLAELIKRGDERLKDTKFIRKRLSELVDAVEYLHNLNIVHCDIKADNVLISPYRDRPAILVDLDKAYTAWLGDTYGDPRKYDTDNCADGSIDFKGIGKIASQLGLKRIAAECNRNDATPETIRQALKGADIRNRFWKWLVAGGIVLTGILLYWGMLTHEANKDDDAGMSDLSLAVQPEDSVSKEPADELTISNEAVKEPESASPTSALSSETSISGPEIKKEEKQVESSDDLDEIVRKYYGPLYKRHEFLHRMLADPYPSAKKLQLIFKSYADDQMKAQGQIMRDVVERYGLTDPFETTPMLATSKEWRRFMEADFKLNQLYSREIEKLEKAEVSQ